MLFMMACSIIAADYWVSKDAEGLLYDDIQAIPEKKVGLVLGTSKYLNPKSEHIPNLYFKHRIEAASALFHAGKVQFLLVSGDNRTHDNNEPKDMKNDLIAKGVPEDRIIEDFAGRRTLDSVLRAHDIFGLSSFTIISQPFHNTRAVYLAKAHGMEVIAFNAKKVNFAEAYWRNRIREAFARVKAVLDVIERQERDHPGFRMKKVVIAISGGSCSGKSTLVQALKNHFNHRIAILQQDNYYLSFDHLTISERSELNFDDPSLIDFKLMQQHLHDLISGQIIKQPFYDFKLHLRKEETKEVNSEPIIILDGLHVLGRLEFRDKINLAVFLDVPEEIRIKRRIDRDQKERGRSEISIKKQLHQ
ncbi:unnamed protein product, partial [Cyprideis torosa]